MYWNGYNLLLFKNSSLENIIYNKNIRGLNRFIVISLNRFNG